APQTLCTTGRPSCTTPEEPPQRSVHFCVLRSAPPPPGAHFRQPASDTSTEGSNCPETHRTTLSCTPLAHCGPRRMLAIRPVSANIGARAQRPHRQGPHRRLPSAAGEGEGKEQDGHDQQRGPRRHAPTPP